MIEYLVKEPATTEVSVFNSKGEQMTRLSQGHSTTGLHRMFYDTDSLTPGQYYIVLTTPTGKTTRILIVARD